MAENLDYQKLRKFVPLQRCTEGELKKLFHRSELWEFQEGSVLAYPGEIWDRAWLVDSGSLVLETPEGERTYYGPGEVCGENFWDTPAPGPGVLRGQTPGRFFLLSRTAVGRSSGLSSGGSPGRVSSLVRKWQFLFPGEVSVLSARPSRWLLCLRVAPWMLLGILAAVWGAAAWVGVGGSLGSRFLGLAALMAGSLSLAGILAGLWLWGREVLILTTESLVHRYFRLTEKKSGVRKIPLSSIQSVTLERKGFFETLLHLGTFKAVTPSIGGDVLFRGLGRPEIWERKIQELKSRDSGSRIREQREELRQYLRGRLGSEAPAKKIKAAEKDQSRAPGKGSWRREGEVFTFRKHPWLLVRAAWWSFLGMLAAGGLGVWGILQGGDPWMVGIPALLGLLGFGLKSGWEFWDWDNDLYQVNQAGVTDFDRKPLWFGESRKDAPWSAIQGVGVEKTGWLGLLLDYGNVKILTGGEDAGMVFEGVKHPELVQTEIFSRRQAYWKSKEAGERTQRLEDTAELLELYDQGKKQGDF